MEFLEYKLEYLVKPKKISVLNWQLNFNEIDFRTDSDLPLISNSDSLDRQFKRIFQIATENSVDLIILPELSVPSNRINLFQDFSKKQGIAIIAGSHYYKKDGLNYSRCPIIINGSVYFTEKINPSPLEKSITVKKGLTPGNEISVFYNTPVGNFATFICADYLDHEIRNKVIELNLDFIVVIAFQSDSTQYFNRFNIDCNDSTNGIYFLYCNGIKDKFSDGNSSLFGFIDKLYHEQFLLDNYSDLVPQTKLCNLGKDPTYFIVDIDLEDKKPKLPRNINTKPNIQIIEFGICESFQNDLFIEKISHTDERYREIDLLFVEPKEFNIIKEKIEKQKIIFIVGDPGIGKTYTSVKLLKEYFSLGYHPFWYVGLEKEERAAQSKILSELDLKEKEIIYFEDPFGRTKFESRDILSRVFSNLIDQLRYTDSRIIITSRKDIFNQFLKESVSNEELIDFQEEMNIVNPSYEKEALKEILKKLATDKCDWYKDKDCREIVEKAINLRQLNTPLAIRDLVFSSINVKDPDDLKSITHKRNNEIIKIFAQEIIQADIPTKILLLLVPIFGYRKQPLLTKTFNDVIIVLNKMLGLKMFTSFKQVLREQKGYRIEILGPQSKGIRISHPSYEDAIMELLSNNLEMVYIMETIIKIVFEEDFFICVSSLARRINKYPDITIKMFNVILGRTKLIEHKNLVYIARRILLGYSNTKRIAFIELLNDLIDINSAIEELNSEKDLSNVAINIQFIYNYAISDPNLSLEFVSNKIDWKILHTKIINSNKYSQIIDILGWILNIDRRIFTSFLEDKIGGKIEQNIIQYDSNERKKIIYLFGEVGFRSIKKTMKQTPLINNVRKIRAFKLKEVSALGSIVIDDGAYMAIIEKKNLLAAGILDVEGNFDFESKITIKNKKKIIGYGICNYSSDEINLIKGCHSSLISEICGKFNGVAVLDRNSMIIKNDG